MKIIRSLLAVVSIGVVLSVQGEAYFLKNAQTTAWKDFTDPANWAVIKDVNDWPYVAANKDKGILEEKYVPGDKITDATSYPHLETDTIDYGLASNYSVDGKRYDYLNLDLKGGSYVIDELTHPQGPGNGDWKNHYLGLTNGTLTFTKPYRPRSFLTTVWNGATLKFSGDKDTYWGQSGIFTTYTIKRGGKVEISDILNIYSARGDVEVGGAFVFDLDYLGWHGTSTSAADTQYLRNAGTTRFLRGLEVRTPTDAALYDKNKQVYRNPEFAILQTSGDMYFGGDFVRTVNCTEPRASVFFELSGGTVHAAKSLSFANVTCSIADGANATIEAAAGATVDLSSFTGGTDATIVKTGKGVIKVASDASFALDVVEGGYKLTTSALPANVTLSEGVTVVFGAKGLAVNALNDYDKYTYAIDEAVFECGDTVVSSSDANLLAFVLAHLERAIGRKFEIADDAIVMTARTEPVVSTWTGAAGDGRWANPNNWSDDVPGVVSDAAGEHGTRNDTAIFADGDATTIDLEGHISVSNLFIRGANAPVWTFGTSAAQVLRIGKEGFFIVEAEVPRAPKLVAALGIGADFTKSTDKTSLYNHSADTLVVGDYGYFTYGTGKEGWASPYWYLGGAGTIRIEGELKEIGGWALQIYDGAKKVVFDNYIKLRRLYGWAMPGAGYSELEVNLTEDGEVDFAGASKNDAMYLDKSLRFTGDGVVRASGDRNGAVWNNCSFGGNSSSVLTFECRLDSSAANNPDSGYRSISGGRTYFRGNNLIRGDMEMLGSGWLVADSIGTNGIKSALGCGNLIRLGFGGRLYYDGPGETVLRTIALSNGIAQVEQAGTGVLRIESELKQEREGTTLLLLNEDGCAHEGVWAGVLADNPYVLNLEKQFSGTWVLAGANTYSGTTAVKAGTLRVAKTGSIASSSSVTVAGGATLEFEGGATVAQSLTSVVVQDGAETIRVGDGVTLTLADLRRTGSGTLDLVTDGAATVKVSGMTSGSDAPVWLKLNGRNVGFDDNGNVVKRLIRIDTPIAARGGVIPNDSTKNVGITTPGESGHVTLANGENAAAAALAQMTAVPAEVEIPANKTLTVGGLYAAEGAEPLTVGLSADGGKVAAVPGEFVLNAEMPNNQITVVAPLDASAATKIVKAGEGVARVASSFGYAKTVQIESGTFAVSNSPVALAATLTGDGTFEWDGSGTYSSNKTQGDFKGDYALSGVAAKLPSVNAYGAVTSGAGDIVVKDGASLDLTSSGSGPDLKCRGLRVAGDGGDGQGAVRASAAKSPYAARLSLDADATVSTPAGAYLHIRKSGTGDNEVSDFGGHALTKAGTGFLTFRETTITNPGPITVTAVDGVSKSGLVLYNGVNLGANGEAAPITLNNGSALYLGDRCPGSKPFDRPLVIAGTNVTINNWATGRVTNENCWAGSVLLQNADSLLMSNPWNDQMDVYVTIHGPISGPGSLRIYNNGRTVISNPHNTYTGRTIIEASQADAYFTYPGSVPDYAKTSIDYGRATVCAHEDGKHWNRDDILAFANQATLKDDAVVAVDPRCMEKGEFTMSLSDDDITNPTFGIGSSLGGKVTVTGAFTKPVTLGSFGGTLALSGAGTKTIANALAAVESTNLWGRISFEGGADVVNRGDVRTGRPNWSYLGFGEIAVKDATLIASPLTSSRPKIELGYRNGAGLLEIGSGAVVSNGLTVAGQSNSRGGVHMTGGTFTAYQNTIVAGSYDAYGFLALEGGDYAQAGYATLASSGTTHLRAQGLVYQTGGTFHHDKEGQTSSSRMWRIGGPTNSIAHVYRNGGTMKVDGQVILINESTGFGSCDATWTQGCNAGRAECDDQFFMADNNGAIVNLNLNGGELLATVFEKSKGAFVGNRAYVNFNGGAATTKRDSSIFGANGNEGLAVDRVTVFEGGAVIGVSNAVTTLDVPLQKPEGNRVVSVPAPDWNTVFPGDYNRYVGPPAVVIKDNAGTGYGATAIVEYDTATKRPGAIKMTSFGCNYTEPVATIRYGTNFVTVACTTGAQLASGGLTKIGAGELDLNVANGYEGETTVLDGVLKVCAPGAVPAGSAINLEGGTFDMNGFSFPGSEIRYGKGAIRNSQGELPTPPSAFVIDMADLKAGKAFTFDGDVSFAANTVVTIVNATADDFADNRVKYALFKSTGAVSGLENVTCVVEDVDPSAHAGWIVRKLGDRIAFSFPRGMALIVR